MKACEDCIMRDVFFDKVKEYIYGQNLEGNISFRNIEEFLEGMKSYIKRKSHGNS